MHARSRKAILMPGLALDVYASQSPLNTWACSYKLTLALVGLITCISFDRLLISLVILFIYSGLLIGPGQVPLSLWWRMMRLPLVFLVLSTFSLALEISPSLPSGTWGFKLASTYLWTSPKLVLAMGEVFLKALASYSCLLFLLMTSPLHDLIGVLQRAKFPSLLVDLMYMTYRFIFILLEVAFTMDQAARARLGFQGYRRSLSSFGKIGSQLFLVAMHKGRHFSLALQARNYQGRLPGALHPIPWKKGQVLCLVSIWCLLVWVRIGLLG